jgi:uncharacterized membrane protein
MQNNEESNIIFGDLENSVQNNADSHYLNRTQQALPSSSASQQLFLWMQVLVGSERVHIVILYVLMIGGGVWHVFNVLQATMRMLSTPMILAVALWSLWWIHRYRFMHKLEAVKTVGECAQDAAETSTYVRMHQQRWYIWCTVVFMLGVVIELVGERTGVIFGEYSYKTAPAPMLMPIAIGAAWLGMMLASTAVVTSLIRVRLWSALSLAQQSGVAGCIAVCMALFDGFMEPAAVALGYWSWTAPYSDSVWLIAPVQNYVAWFCISFVFAFVGLRTSVVTTVLPMPRFVVHTFVAQLLYFVTTNLAK